MGRQKRAYQSVTIRDVAERAGVAVSTVSRVLNGLDRVSEETQPACRTGCPRAVLCTK